MRRWPSVPMLIGLLAALLMTAGCINWFLLRPRNGLPARGNAELPLPAVKGPAILKLELVWRDEDITRILAPAGNDSEAIRRTIADARAGNLADTWLFVPSYSLLLVTLGALGAATAQRRRSLFTAVLIGAVVVAAGDWLENLAISRALDHLERGGVQPGDALAISTPALVKWTMLPFVLALIAAQLLTAKRWWTLVLGVVSASLALLIAFGIVTYASERAMDTEAAERTSDRAGDGWSYVVTDARA